MRPVGKIERALAEADEYFMGRGRVREAAGAITKVLSDAGIPHAIAGALACAAHGHERMTTDVDVLIRREDLASFKETWLGRGYVDVTPGLKAVRDTARNVKIDFLITGDYPGDGKPKPVSFPEPERVAEEGGPFPVVSLPRLLELKIASGMTAAHRMRDLDDAMRLIAANELSLDYASELDPYVRAKYAELWKLAQVQDDY
jgi:hypothetical protein